MQRLTSFGRRTLGALAFFFMGPATAAPNVTDTAATAHVRIRLLAAADAVHPGQRVVVVDDLLATGGTMAAGIALLRQVGAVVPAAATLMDQRDAAVDQPSTDPEWCSA